MAVSSELLARLAATRTIDLITYGRRTGLPRRIEIWWFHVEDRFVITGTPGRRDWLANVRANPRVIVKAAGVELPGLAVEIEDAEFRRRVFSTPHTSWYSTQAQLEALVATAPMIEVSL
ncbi:MAG: nitroreductase family deazaflavin-dependent oxidoreductase [Actinobacteria bacterium]|nr:nitroreductase family deazaflavin-dependent oxidoreductase [Actinomycetota bacterium]